MIRWDSGFAASYLIQASLDGKQWRTAFDTSDSPGDVEYVFFPSVTAHYLQLASKPRTADWMASMFELGRSPRATYRASAACHLLATRHRCGRKE